MIHVIALNTSKGGDIYIGIEDDCSLPPPKQIIPEELPGKIQDSSATTGIN